MKKASFFQHKIWVSIGFFGGFVVITITWILGGYFFNFSDDNLIIFFGEKEFLSSTFAPIAALFSGISAIATVCLIFIQIYYANKQKLNEQVRIFENQLFQIFSMRTEIIKSLKYNDGEQDFKGIAVCEIAYKMLNFYFVKYSKIKNIHYTYKYRVKDELVTDIEMLIDEKGKYVIPDLITLVKIILEYIDDKTRFVLYPYYHNIYITLKMIEEFPLISPEEKDSYIRIFRSQLSQFEFCLLYYHVLTHKDKHSWKSKFKNFVENCSFFHTTSETMLFYQFNAKEFKNGYKETAFKHPDEIKNKAS